jgi:two-component system OmpR family sensor kinase/two-component system sensor histidine kinase BaeS
VIWALGRAWTVNPLGMLSLVAPLALGAILFVYGVRRVGRPLGDVVGAADRVADGDFSVRVRERGSPWLRRLGRAFNSMTERLERQQQQRRDLMADVAHELRTPLAVMQGRLEGMVDGVYPHDAAQVAQILEETRHLNRLVDDLRTLAHSEGGTLTLEREPTDLGVLLNDAGSAFRSHADRRHVSLTVNAANDLPIVDVDPLRVREVAANLLANAIRYAPEAGSVTVDAHRDATSIVVSVSDDGPGISEQDLPHVFDRFYKARSSSGSGLGLAIAHSLVTAHGGTIAASSEPGRGTTITFRLPLTPVI